MVKALYFAVYHAHSCRQYGDRDTKTGGVANSCLPAGREA